MGVIVSLCGNAMINIDQPVIILASIDNEGTIILLIWTRNIYGCHCDIYSNAMIIIDQPVAGKSIRPSAN